MCLFSSLMRATVSHTFSFHKNRRKPHSGGAINGKCSRPDAQATTDVPDVFKRRKTSQYWRAKCTSAFSRREQVKRKSEFMWALVSHTLGSHKHGRKPHSGCFRWFKSAWQLPSPPAYTVQWLANRNPTEFEKWQKSNEIQMSELPKQKFWRYTKTVIATNYTLLPKISLAKQMG